MENKTLNKRFLIPQIISGLRIINAVLFWFLFFNNLIVESFILFHISYLTDIFDGICARRLEVTSTFGAYFDAIADFIFIFITFTAFVMKDIYPFWILIIIAFWFLQFIVTSRKKEQIYDPIGKYTGLFLYITIGITLPLSDSLVYNTILIAIVIYFILSLISRYIALSSQKTK